MFGVCSVVRRKYVLYIVSRGKGALKIFRSAREALPPKNLTCGPFDPRAGWTENFSALLIVLTLKSRTEHEINFLGYINRFHRGLLL